MRNVSLSPILTVSTSRWRVSKMRILGGGASGADVILIISGSLREICHIYDSIFMKLIKKMQIDTVINSYFSFVKECYIVSGFQVIY